MQNPEPTESELAFAKEAAQTQKAPRRHSQVAILGASALALGSLIPLAATGQEARLREARDTANGLTDDEKLRAQIASGQASPDAKARLERLREEARQATLAQNGYPRSKGSQVRRHQKPKSAQAPFTLHAKETADNNNYKIRDLCANDALSSAIALIGVALETGGSVKLQVTDATGKPVFKMEVEGFQTGLEIPLMDDIRAANSEDNL